MYGTNDDLLEKYLSEYWEQGLNKIGNIFDSFLKDMKLCLVDNLQQLLSIITKHVFLRYLILQVKLLKIVFFSFKLLSHFITFLNLLLNSKKII